MLSSGAASVPGKPWNFLTPERLWWVRDGKEVGHSSMSAFLITRCEDSQGLKRALSHQNLSCILILFFFLILIQDSIGP